MSETKALGTAPNGYTLFCEPNECGGFRYYSDEINGGVLVWDTCLVSEFTLLLAINDDRRRRGTKPIEYDLEM